MAKAKKCSESYVRTTELVLPNDTNTLNNLMGGKMMHWMDIVAAISASRHSNRVVVTASVDSVSFHEGIKLGSVVTLEAKVTRAFSSSMEVHVVAHVEDLRNQVSRKSNEAFLTFVAVDQNGRPIDVPVVEPESDEEKRYYDSALRRRQLRLILAGRMKPEQATELKSIFDIKEGQ